MHVESASPGVAPPAAVPPPGGGTIAHDLLQTVRVLRGAGTVLFAQAVVYAELAGVELREEKRRLLRLVATTLLGYACLQCLLLMLVALAISASWDTPYRLPVLSMLLVAFAAGCMLAWRRLQGLVAAGERSFAGTREELAADLALLRTKL